jgi:hypothetical protein
MTDIFQLPLSTHVNRVIPKNAFDQFTDTKEKKDFVDKIDKIRWLYKIATDTTNLPPGEVVELQVFEISLRKRDEIPGLIKVIDRSIPYPIIFILTFGEELMFSLSKKHPHPTHEDKAVIDWTFTTTWVKRHESSYRLNLKESLDYVFADFCRQLAGKNSDRSRISVPLLIEREKKIQELQTSIRKLEAAIARAKQFNRKVELNIELQRRREELGMYS